MSLGFGDKQDFLPPQSENSKNQVPQELPYLLFAPKSAVSGVYLYGSCYHSMFVVVGHLLPSKNLWFYQVLIKIRTVFLSQNING